MQNIRIRLLFALFAASGCTGLIYESVWTHYLKLFIGTAAFAQSFVLVVFMGGLAFGAWLASRWSARFPDPLVAYAAIEALIGLAALGFHELYTLSTAAALDHVIPALGSPLAVEVFKYGLCTILIAPQTVLLGMTFPLMSTAVIRREPQRGGHHLAMLYFTNSIGAAIGALAAAFWLLGWLGMPGTMRTAGAVNLVLAAVVVAIARRDAAATAAAAPVATGAVVRPGLVRLLLVAAFVTGAASFVYEIAWIRMLSLVLGTSFHAFELMLSARHVGGRRELEALFGPLQAPANSDFHPFVQLQAPRARFAGARARSVVELAIAPLPIREMLGGAQRATLREPAPAHVLSAPVRAQSTALAIARALMDPAADPWAQGDATVRQIAVALRGSRGLCTAEPAAEVVAQLHRAAEGTLAHLAPPLRQALWVQRLWLDCAGQRPAAGVQRRLDLYAAIAERDARRMLALSQALLESPGRETQRDWGQFLLSTALLGARAQGDGRAAQQVWARWGGALFPGGAVPPPVVYLLNVP